MNSSQLFTRTSDTIFVDRTQGGSWLVVVRCWSKGRCTRIWSPLVADIHRGTARSSHGHVCATWERWNIKRYPIYSSYWDVSKMKRLIEAVAMCSWLSKRRDEHDSDRAMPPCPDTNLKGYHVHSVTRFSCCFSKTNKQGLFYFLKSILYIIYYISPNISFQSENPDKVPRIWLRESGDQNHACTAHSQSVGGVLRWDELSLAKRRDGA